jgi:5-methylcytosine-specific restriction endonuclease McrA
MDNLRTLVLRKDYQPFSLFPISCIPARDAVTRVVAGTCEVISNYNIRIKTANPDLVVHWPSVIRSLDPKVKKLRSIPSLTDESLYYRDHATCAYCGKGLTIQEVTMDHVVPSSKGGPKTWDNIVAACTKCNSEKDNLPASGKWLPKRLPYTPTIWDLIKIRKTYPVTVPDESWVPWLGGWNGEIKIMEAA